MARAWPRLKWFTIRIARLRLAHQALIPFAKYCPELEVLGMMIDATDVSDYEERPGRESESLGPKLRELIFFD